MKEESIKDTKTAASVKLRAFVLKRSKEKQALSKSPTLADTAKLPFRSSKSPIEFVDYEPGESYSLVFEMINCSTRRNSFRFLPLSPEMNEVFTVAHEPIGRMAPGMSCVCTLNFFPALRSDSDFCLSVNTDQGSFPIPIHCRYKRTKVELAQPALEVPATVVFETTECCLRLTNKGGLGTNYEVFTAEGEKLFPCDSRRTQTTGPTLRIECSGFVAGYAMEEVKVLYSPTEPGFWSTDLQFRFENSIDQPALTAALRGSALKPPVETDKAHLDFGIVLMGGNYKERILLLNTSSHTAKMEVVSADEVKSLFHFSPQNSYIQPKSTLAIWVKLCVTEVIESALTERYGQSPEFSIPFDILLSVHSKPLRVTVSFTLSSDQLVFPRSLSFEGVYEHTSTALRAEFRNQALVSQTLCFLDLPQHISLRPPVNPLVLPPAESCDICFIYQGRHSGNDDGFFRLRVLIGSERACEFYISYRACVLAAPLRFKPGRLLLPVIPRAESHRTTVAVTNASSKKLYVELGDLDLQITGLSFEPHTMLLDGGACANLHVEYLPSRQELDPAILKERSYQSSEGFRSFKLRREELAQSVQELEGALGQKLSKQEREGKEERLARLRAYREHLEAEGEAHRVDFEKNFDVAAFFKSHGGEVFHLDNITVGRWVLPVYFRGIDDFSLQRMWIEVYTGLRPQVAITNCLSVNFGKVPLFSQKVVDVPLFNSADAPLKISCASHDFVGVFSFVSNPLSIPPATSKQLSVAFAPPTEGHFKNTLRIGGDSPLELAVQGEGIAAAYKFSCSHSLFNCGIAPLGGRIEKTLRFENLSDVPLSFEFQPSEALGAAPSRGSTINFFPGRSVVNKGDFCTISVFFEPLTADSLVFEVFNFCVEGEERKKKIGFIGMCFSDVGYIAPYIDYERMSIIEVRKILGLEEQCAAFLYNCDPKFLSQNNQIINRETPLEVGPEQSKIVLGCAPYASVAGLEFAVTLKSNDDMTCIQIEPSKGKLSPGQNCVVTFTSTIRAATYEGIYFLRTIELEVEFTSNNKSEKGVKKNVIYHFHSSF